MNVTAARNALAGQNFPVHAPPACGVVAVQNGAVQRGLRQAKEEAFPSQSAADIAARIDVDAAILIQFCDHDEWPAERRCASAKLAASDDATVGV